MLNFVISTLATAMNFFCEKMQDVYKLLTIDPETYRGGAIWDVSMKIFMALLGTGFAIIMISAYLGIIGSLDTIFEARKAEVFISLFAMVTICGGLLTVTPDLLLLIVKMCQGIIKKATGGSFVFADLMTIPGSVINATKDLDTLKGALFWLLCLIGAGTILMSTFTILLMSYGRIFKTYMYIAVAPLAIGCFASKQTQRIGINFVKLFIIACLEGLVIIVALMLFSAFNGSYGATQTELTKEQEQQVQEIMDEYGCTYAEAVDAVKMDENFKAAVSNMQRWSYQKPDTATDIVFTYVIEQSFLFLLLLSLIKGSDKEVGKLFGF